MKNMYKYALLFALAGGAALFTGCRADEEVDLAGYPETPVGAKDGLMPVAIAMAAAKSFREGRPVKLDEILG